MLSENLMNGELSNRQLDAVVGGFDEDAAGTKVVATRAAILKRYNDDLLSGKRPNNPAETLGTVTKWFWAIFG